MKIVIIIEFAKESYLHLINSLQEMTMTLTERIFKRKK